MPATQPHGSAPAPTPLWDLRQHAAQAPERTALRCGTARLSYGALEALANRLAAVLRHLGLQRGDHIASLLGNRPEGLALAWAAWRTGLYLTPLPTTLTTTELRYLVQDCEARAVLACASLQAPLEAVATELGASARIHWLSLGGPTPGATAFQALEPLLVQASPEPATHEPPGALMMYTSGTTGQPKGVIRPLLPAEWRGTPPFAADLMALFGVGGEDVRYLSTAPLYHAAALRFALAVTAGGGQVQVMEKFDARTALAHLAQSGPNTITHSQWVPAMFQRLLALPVAERLAFKAPAHHLAIHGAAPCPVAVKRAMIEWWGPILTEYYSGSEGVGLTMLDSHEALAHPGSVGRARKGQLHIARLDDPTQGQALRPGESGLVCFSGISPFAYHKAPEKTAARTLPQGWQSFGDIGHVEAEGYLYLTDRQDDMIISGGVNVYPQEIETAICAVPGVWDCAVAGVADEQFGERPVAFVVARRSDSGGAPNAEDEALLREAVRRHCEQHLGRIKRPDAIHFIEELPRTPTGKLQRRRLVVPAQDRESKT